MGNDDAGRRGFLKAGLSGMAAAAIWAEVARARPSAAGGEGSLLAVVSDLTIPATQVPGAVAAGVPQFLTIAIAHHTLGAKGDEAGRLRAELDTRGGGDFLLLPASRQFAALSALDHDALAHGVAADSAWPVVKSLILAGYYSSELGGARDQRYELVPGRFDADIPYRKGDPALSNDWAGVAFR